MLAYSYSTSIFSEFYYRRYICHLTEMHSFEFMECIRPMLLSVGSFVCLVVLVCKPKGVELSKQHASIIYTYSTNREEVQIRSGESHVVELYRYRIHKIILSEFIYRTFYDDFSSSISINLCLNLYQYL